jgi:SprT-like family
MNTFYFEELSAGIESRWIFELNSELHTLAHHRRMPQLKLVTLELSDTNNELGRWNPQINCVSISRKLIQQYPWECVLGVLYHELAHALVSLGDKKLGTPHGDAFQNACTALNVPLAYRTATINLEDILRQKTSQETTPSEDHVLLRRAEKLSQLSQSQNQHEASLALSRLDSLRKEFNFQRALKNQENFFTTLVLRTGKKRFSRVHQKLGSILGEFYGISVIYDSEFNPKDACRYRTIVLLGARHEVLFAEYVYLSLMQQLNLFTKDFLKQEQPSDRSAGETFKYGVLVGYSKKLRTDQEKANAQKNASATQSAHSQEEATTTALIVNAYELKKTKELENFVSYHYPKLVSSSSNSKISNVNSFNAGIEAGQNVTIHKPIVSQNSGRQISAPQDKF